MGLIAWALRRFLKVKRWDSGGTALILKEKQHFGEFYGKV
tara:strand:+ start:1368 stop:1487 length:120 start_codon:yes stop_codon:yes gene_type:complete